MAASNVPNFLCIGAQKAASSWLQHNLRQHPDVWMTPVKELHYFDIAQKTPIIFHAGQNTLSGTRYFFARRHLRRHPRWTLRYEAAHQRFNTLYTERWLQKAQALLA